MLLSLSLLPSLRAKAATETKLVVKLTSGSTSIFYLSSRPVVTFTNDKLTIELPDEPDGTFEIFDVANFFFSNDLGQEEGASGQVDEREIPVATVVTRPEPSYGLTPEYVPMPGALVLTDDDVTLEVADYVYTGIAIQPTCIVKYNNNPLVAGTDYSVSYSNNTLPGQATMTVTGLGTYSGMVTKSFTISPRQSITAVINGVEVEGVKTVVDATSAYATFESEYGKIWVENCYALPNSVVDVRFTPSADFTISTDSIEPAMGEPTVLSNGLLFHYTIPASGAVTIEATFYKNVDFSNAILAQTEEHTYIYTGNAIEPAYKLTLKGQELVAGTDYSLNYKDNVGAGTATVTATSMGNYTGTATATFTINKAPLTVKAEAKSKVYGEALPELTYQMTGFVNNEDAEVLKQQPVIVTEATAISAVGEYAITVSGAEADNYEFIYEDAMLTVTKAMLTVMAEDKSKAYGEAVPELTASIKGFVNDENAVVLTKQPVAKTEATVTSGVGEYAITVIGAEAENYDFTYESAKLTVTKAMLAVTAEDKSKTYGEAVPELTTSIKGFVNDEDAAVLKHQPVAETEANVESTVGEYAITVSGAEADNYDFTYEGAKLTVTKAMLTVTADAQTKVYGEKNPELTATITGYVNGEDASAITTMPVVTTDCTTKSAVDKYTITVSGGEAQNYEFTYVPATLTVTSRSLANATLKLTSDSVAYTGQSVLPEFTVWCGSATLIEGTDYDVTPANNTEPGTATLTVTGKGNYEGQIETTFTIYLKPTVEVVINDMAVKPVLDENDEKHRAEFVTDNGKVIVSDYYALPGDMVVLTIVPTDDWLLGEESILVSVPVEVLLSQQSSYVGTYSVPENGMVSISVLFLNREAVGINDYAGALRFEVVDGKTVRVLGAREMAPVSVFDARGQQVAAEVVRSDRELIVRLANQPQGLYIIKVNNNTFKVYRK